MASQPNLSSKYLNVPALRHCCRFRCIPGKNNMMASLQIYLHRWQEQDDCIRDGVLSKSRNVPVLRHYYKLSCIYGKRTIRQHCCKCTFSDGENRTMASQPNLSSKYLNVPASRHCCTLCCIPGKNNMRALLQIHLR